jgi:hypothetical protein
MVYQVILRSRSHAPMDCGCVAMAGGTTCWPHALLWQKRRKTMSIKEMIKDHPQVGADYNDELGEAIRHAMYCAAICNSCADACNAEPANMSECIRKCMDCADICEAVTRVASRRTAGTQWSSSHCWRPA